MYDLEKDWHLDPGDCVQVLFCSTISKKGTWKRSEYPIMGKGLIRSMIAMG